MRRWAGALAPSLTFSSPTRHNDDNVGSIKTIEKNGGVLESIIAGTDGDTPKRRYWIATGDQRRPAASSPALSGFPPVLRR